MITSTDLNFEREPLAAPFGFKGGYLSELWQTIARVATDTGAVGVGTGIQSVLWSDPRVFLNRPESSGNALMYAITSRALELVKGSEVSAPLDLLQQVLPELIQYGGNITGIDIKPTFALNAYVPVDNAIWLAHAMEIRSVEFDDIIPAHVRSALSARSDKVISVPAVGYGMSLDAIESLVNAGNYVLKIKIGSDPAKNGDQDAMLAWDMQRMSEIQTRVGSRFGGPKGDEQVRYYLDANQRYDSPERLMRLLEHLDRIGALAQTILLEEPFAEENMSSVSKFPVCVVADESAHTERDVSDRIDLGYGAIALKPVAKTLSMTFEIARVAAERGVTCFCADLTVHPLLVDWNKSIAARCVPLPGLKASLLENNGVQNYPDWERLIRYHPRGDAKWVRPSRGEFVIDDEFYRTGGGIFDVSSHYASLVSRG